MIRHVLHSHLAHRVIIFIECHPGYLRRYSHPALFFPFTSTVSTFFSGTPPSSTTQSKISSELSPCTTTSSPPLAVFVTLAPVANFFPHSLATFFRSMPCTSSPCTAVTYLRLLRSTRLMRTLAEARVSSARDSARAALASFFCESLSARFCASTERVEREALRASRGWN